MRASRHLATPEAFSSLTSPELARFFALVSADVLDGLVLALRASADMTPRASLRESLHELRNAVTGVVSWAQMLESGSCGKLTDPQARAVARMVDGAARALHAAGKLEVVGERAQIGSAPPANGFELIAALRGQSDTRTTQVVVVTAHGGGRDWELLRGLGVTGFFVKPLEPSALAAVLRRAAASHVTPRGLLNRNTHSRGV